MWIGVFLSFKLGMLNARYRGLGWSMRSPVAHQVLVVCSITLIVSFHAMYWHVWDFFTPAIVLSLYLTLSMLTHFVPTQLVGAGR